MLVAVLAPPRSTVHVQHSRTIGCLFAVFALGTLVPSLAPLVRRLRDANLSGWLALVALVPFLGSLAVVIRALLPSTPAGKRFDLPTVPAPAYKA